LFLLITCHYSTRRKPPIAQGCGRQLGILPHIERFFSNTVLKKKRRMIAYCQKANMVNKKHPEEQKPRDAWLIPGYIMEPDNPPASLM
jgi:hypothetical protein